MIPDITRTPNHATDDSQHTARISTWHMEERRSKRQAECLIDSAGSGTCPSCDCREREREREREERERWVQVTTPRL
jgi:hypothetical protein